MVFNKKLFLDRLKPTPLWKALLFEKRLPTRYIMRLSFIPYLYYKLKIKKPDSFIEDYITIVITSSGRKDYLKKTLKSLKKNLQFEKNKIFWHIIDDCPNDNKTRKFIKQLGFDIVIFNKKNKGLGYSLNKIYSTIRTKFVFHCEDDWEFLRPIPIKKMISILNKNKDLGQLILRRDCYSKYFSSKKEYVLYEDYFSFNPHLAKSEVFFKLYPFPLRLTEVYWTIKARLRGYKSGIFGHKKFVKHLGIIKKVKKY